MSDLYTFDDDTNFDEIFGDLNLTMLHSGERHRVFVYGTLMTGMRNHRRMESEDITLISSVGTTKGYYKMLSRKTARDYFAPIVVRSEPVERIIIGEVYEVSDQELMKLDMFEGHPDVYCRVKTPVIYSTGEEIVNENLWMYVFVDERFPLSNEDDAMIFTQDDWKGVTNYRWKGEKL